MKTKRSVRGSEISATQGLVGLVRWALSARSQSFGEIYAGEIARCASKSETSRALRKLVKAGDAVRTDIGDAGARWHASSLLIAARDTMFRRRIIMALDGTHPMNCTVGVLKNLARWHEGQDSAAVLTSDPHKAAAALVLSKLTGYPVAKLSLTSRPATVLVIEGGAHWAYDVVEVGPAAIELRYTGASAEKETRMFRRSDGVAIDDPKVRIAPEDLARLTERTTAEVSRAAGEDAGREVAKGFVDPLRQFTKAMRDVFTPVRAGTPADAATDARERCYYALDVGSRVRGRSDGRVALVKAWVSDNGKESYVLAFDDGSELRIPQSIAHEDFEHIPGGATDAAIKQGLGGEGPVPPRDKHAASCVENREGHIGECARPDIHAQIDAWTTEALQGLAPRISARVWQAYRAGQGQGGYSEAGHELAAQEAERLRAFLAAEQRRAGELREELQKEQARFARAAADISGLVAKKNAAERERDDAREELHLAETSLVTSAKERDDATDRLAASDADLRKAQDLHAETYASLVQVRGELELTRARCDALQAELRNEHGRSDRLVDMGREAAKERDAARAELADLRAGISALTSGRAA